MIHFVPQVDFICDGEQLKVDEFFKLEDYENSIQHLEGKLGVSISRIRENRATDDVRERKKISVEAMQLLREIYSDDYRLLDMPDFRTILGCVFFLFCAKLQFASRFAFRC